MLIIYLLFCAICVLAQQQQQLLLPASFTLEEEQCNVDFWSTRLHIPQLGYFQNEFWTWNQDLCFYNDKHEVLVSTDIQSFLKLRTQQHIYDENHQLIAIVEQELFNNIVNKLIRDAVGIASPYRRYTIYGPDGTMIGVTRKYQIADTFMEFMDVNETRIVAKASKSLSSQVGSLFCQPALWQVYIFDSKAIDPRIVATVVAIKARTDAVSASATRWNILDQLVSWLTKEEEKND